MAQASESEIQYLPGVGPKRAELLRKELNVSTISDLLRLYPFRYIDRSSIVRISDARPDMAYLQIRAKVLRIDLFGNKSQPAAQDNKGDKEIRFNTIKRMSVWVGDGSGEMELVFFKGIKWMYGKLKPGAEFVFFGKPTAFNGRINMVHPEADAAPSSASAARSVAQATPAATPSSSTTQATTSAGTMNGIYPSTERLKNGGITGKMMTRIMESALEKGLQNTQESLPEYIMKQCGLVPLHFALRNIHFPKDMVALDKAKYRLKFEELFYLQLSLLKQKYVRSRAENGIHMPKVGEAFNKCYEALPFPLTGAQKRVITEIRNDMKSGRQMKRLLRLSGMHHGTYRSACTTAL